MLCVVRAATGPVGPSDAQAVAATGYSGAYLGSIGLSLAADPLYGSRLLDSFGAPPALRRGNDLSARGDGLP